MKSESHNNDFAVDGNFDVHITSESHLAIVQIDSPLEDDGNAPLRNNQEIIDAFEREYASAQHKDSASDVSHFRSRQNYKLLFEVDPKAPQLDAVVENNINTFLSSGKSEFRSSSHLEPVHLYQDGTSKWWFVGKDYSFKGNLNDSGSPSSIPLDFEITIYKGFKFDRASIPFFLQTFFFKDTLGNPSPLIHDYLYRHGGKGNDHSGHTKVDGKVEPKNRMISRAQADHLFLLLLELDGVSWARRKLAYFGVRIGGGFGYWS